MKTKLTLTSACTLAFAGIVLCACGSEAGREYSNSAIPRSLPDPTIIRAQDGNFYLYATEDVRNLPIYRSPNLVDWTFVGTAFSEETRPRFEPRGGIWAPDINYIGGKYVLYYAMSRWGGIDSCGIGVAVANQPQGPFTDKGAVFRSFSIGVRNSIDANYFEDEGKKYLFWGSYGGGIWGIELAEDGLSVKDGAQKRQVAADNYEGTYIHKRNGYYYLFASIGSCCEGLTSTYQTVVGRADNLWGPYLDKNGGSMLDRHHELVISGNDAFVGVGHNSEIVQDEAGSDWIMYHGYVLSDTSKRPGRQVFLDRVTWANDWPVVNDGTPTKKCTVPVFNAGK